MKLNDKIQISYHKLFSHLFCVYLTAIALGHEAVLSSAAVIATTTQASPKSVTPVPYVRKSRDTAGVSPTSAPESIDGQEQFGTFSGGNTGRFFAYPSFKHKYQMRVSRFHGGPEPAAGPATRTYSIRSMAYFPKLNPGLHPLKSGEMLARYPYPAAPEQQQQQFENEEQDPTFTPFIGASALSNIPEFFQHLRSNLEALQLDDVDEGSDEEGERLPLGQSANDYEQEGKVLALQQQQQPEKQMKWVPAGMLGRAHLRHFIQDPETGLFYRKPNVYEFGLG